MTALDVECATCLAIPGERCTHQVLPSGGISAHGTAAPGPG